MKQSSYGFTLVELVISMTLIAILGTIATIYLFDVFGVSRDSGRITSIGQITETLELFELNAGKYPIPDSPTSVTFSGAEIWAQGTFGSSVSQNLGVFGSQYPQDPLHENDYTYSITNDSREYQIGAMLEDTKGSLEDPFTAMLIPQTHASISTAYVRGNYNGFLARAIVGSDHYFITTPSIIATNLDDTDVINIITSQDLVFDQFFNLPSQYALYTDVQGGFGFTPSSPVIFSGALNNLQYEQTLVDFIDELKYTYSASPIAGYDDYISMIEGDTYTEVKKLLENNFGVPFAAHNCNDIYLGGEGLSDGFYVIDGVVETLTVYCDMTTDGGGWTRVGEDYITNGDFAAGTGSGILSESGSNSNNNVVDLGTANTPVDSAYVLHQTSNSGWSDTSKSQSEYQVRFDDDDAVTPGYQFPGSLQPGYEIRMSLWLRDDDDGATWLGCTTGPCKHNPYQGYVFHNRLFYTDGTNEVNGSVETLDTQITDDGKTWKLQRLRKTVRKEPSGFDWYIGYGAELTTDLYFTDVKLEIFYR